MEYFSIDINAILANKIENKYLKRSVESRIGFCIVIRFPFSSNYLFFGWTEWKSNFILYFCSYQSL